MKFPLELKIIALKKLPHLVRASLDIVPGLQEVHAVAPSSSETEFSGHFVQLLTESSRYVPAVQLTEEYWVVQSFLA